MDTKIDDLLKSMKGTLDSCRADDSYCYAAGYRNGFRDAYRMVESALSKEEIDNHELCEQIKEMAKRNNITLKVDFSNAEPYRPISSADLIIKLIEVTPRLEDEITIAKGRKG